MNRFRTLEAREIECRVARVIAGKTPQESGVSLLLYKDARCDMNILDETVGAMNWKRAHTRDNANCIVSIWDAEKKEWISKEDTGTESNTEAEKGLASDSFKRACVNWSIGRELYTAPSIWIDGTKCKITQANGKPPKCNDKFTVSNIGYDEHREINSLSIVNKRTGETVFHFGHMQSDQPNYAEQMKAMGTAKDAAAFVMPAGQYAGMTIGDIYKMDRKYVIGLLDAPGIDSATKNAVYTVLNAARAAAEARKQNAG